MSYDMAVQIVLSAIQQPASENAIQVFYCYDEVEDGMLFPDCILKPRQKECRAFLDFVFALSLAAQEVTILSSY